MQKRGSSRDVGMLYKEKEEEQNLAETSSGGSSFSLSSEDSEEEGPSPAAETAVRRFPLPAQGFRRGPRYLWHRAVGLLCRALGCRCRRAQPWEDPRIFSEGTVDPHAPLTPSKEGCLRLSGEWRFKLFAKPSEALSTRAELPSFDDDEGWDAVPVPSQWQLLGYEPPIYTNMIYPFTNCPCRRPSFAKVSTGVYRRKFRLPEGFAKPGQPVRLLLQGVSSACTVWLNGEKLGYHQDSGLPAEFDVCRALAKKQEEHVLVVCVVKWCDGSYLEDQDTWWLSGIHREVLLYPLPVTNAVEDYFVSTAVDAPYDEAASAEVLVQVKLRNFDASQVTCTVSDGAETLAKGSFDEQLAATGALGAVFGLGSPIVSCRLRLQSPAKWSPDKPKLYKLKLELSRGGQALQSESWRFGVRDVRVCGGKLRLNGSPLLINGVNRVEMDPDMGKAVPLKRIHDDLCLLKKHNFNAVRTAHCPNSTEFYEACDELGLLVVDEANIETHGFAMVGLLSFLQCEPAWKGAIFERIKAMFCRDKNFTCIVGWSLGNEAGVGPNNAAGADFLRLADCSRWVQYESGQWHGDASPIMGDGRHPLSDLVCPMYADPEGCVKLCREEKRPLVMCEYSHAMGNSNGALHHFYNVFSSEDYPTSQGGFIWDFADQGLRAPKHPHPKSTSDWFLSRHCGYGGDFGEETGTVDKWFCCNGLNLPDRTPKPAMIECRYLMQPLRISAEWKLPGISITFAHRAQSSLKGLTLCWAASSHGEVQASGSAAGGSQSQTLLQAQLPAAGPGLWLRAWAELAADRPWAEKGHVVAEEMILLSQPSPEPPLAAPLPAGIADVRSRGSGLYEVQGKTYRVELKDGRLLRMLDKNGKALLSNNGVGHAFWRLPTDNDRGGADVFMPKKLSAWMPWGLAAKMGFPPSLAQQWRAVGLGELEAKVSSSSWEGACLSVETEHEAKGRVLFSVTTEMAFGASSIEINVTVRPNGAHRALQQLPTLPRVGLRLTLPPELSYVTWLGRGPHECYPDRKASAPMNVHSSTVEEMHFPYIVPGECGGRADVQWAALQDAEGRGLVAQYRCEESPQPESIETGSACARPAGSCGAQFSAARFTPEEAEGAAHDFQLPKGKELPVVLHLDTAHCGVGGVGGATEAVWRFHEQYFVDPKTPEWRYSVVLTPLAPGQLLAPGARGAPVRNH